MNRLIKELWDNYMEITPSVAKIKKVLGLENDVLFADHIAYRSINVDSCGIERISRPFLDIGYVIKKTYYFEQKKLRAIHLENDFSKKAPKIFISELMLEKCSLFLRRVLLNAFQCFHFSEENILTSGRKWKIKYKVYKELEKESKYAAWLYIHGIRVNHFTLNVSQLENYTIENLCNKLIASGISLNKSGGIIKGSESKGLKQASTMADKIQVQFDDLYNEINIPSCYVEFAQRYLVEKKQFKGFLVESANKIFESTNRISI